MGICGGCRVCRGASRRNSSRPRRATPAIAAEIGGAILLVAGIYQLTPIKEICLSKCRTSIDFIITSSRVGTADALPMGLLHGAYCLGCCWLLFVILFPLGMNVEAMGAVTLIISPRKRCLGPRSHLALRLLRSYFMVRW